MLEEREEYISLILVSVYLICLEGQETYFTFRYPIIILLMFLPYAVRPSSSQYTSNDTSYISTLAFRS